MKPFAAVALATGALGLSGAHQICLPPAGTPATPTPPGPPGLPL